MKNKKNIKIIVQKWEDITPFDSIMNEVLGSSLVTIGWKAGTGKCQVGEHITIPVDKINEVIEKLKQISK
jgi:hypothetical protein